jgi:hypothetical protein
MRSYRRGSCQMALTPGTRLSFVRLLVSHSFVKLRPLPIRVKRPEEERLAKQTADLHSLETVLLRAREIAEGLGEVVIVYFIDMAIAETRRKGPLLAKDHKPRIRRSLRASRKKRNTTTRDLDQLDGLSSGLASKML